MPSTFDVVRAMKGVADSLAKPEDLDQTLLGVTLAAQEILTGVDHASVSMLRRDSSIDTIAPTDPLAQRADELQYEFGEGPCVQAVKARADVVVRDVATDTRWPEYAPRAAQLGVVSQLSLHLHDDERTWGSLNLYSRGVGPFDDVSREIADLFATSAGVALGLSNKMLTLTEAVATRTTIGAAIGIVMEHYGLDENRAFAFLVRTSQAGNVKLRMVARRLVDDTNQKATA